MGSKLSNFVGVDDRSGEQQQCSPEPSTADRNNEEEDQDLFWTWRQVQDQNSGGDEDQDLFWTWRQVQDQNSGGDEDQDLFWTWRQVQDQNSGGDEDQDLFWTWRQVQDQNCGGDEDQDLFWTSRQVQNQNSGGDEDQDLFWTWRQVQDQNCGGDEDQDLFWTSRQVQNQNSGGDEDQDLFWTWRQVQDQNSGGDEDQDLFWTWRQVQDQNSGGDEDQDLFWTWRQVQDQNSGGDEDQDLFWTWRTGPDQRDQASDDETSEQNVTAVDQETETTEIHTTPDPVPIESDCNQDLASDWDEKIQPVLFDLAKMKVYEDEEEEEEEDIEIILDANKDRYKIGDIFAEGSSGLIYEATRMSDGLKVAVKYVAGAECIDYISIPSHPVPLLREVALHMLACGEKGVPEIVKLLDWAEGLDDYIMVLEFPTPCMDLLDFLAIKGGKLYEELAKDIMWQATMAAYTCFKQGVFHRDITMTNLIVTTDLLIVKLTDFGCSDLLQRSTYRKFIGTRNYACPEFFKTGEYKAAPATVYSLGTLLFAMLCGKFPNCNDKYAINERFWSKDRLTEECCDLVEACLQEDPGKRMDLEKILEHKWFQDKYPTNSPQAAEDAGAESIDNEAHVQKSDLDIDEINFCQYEIGAQIGEGSYGTVFEGTRVRDGLKVAVKKVDKIPEVNEDNINIPGYPEPLPREVGLQMLACRGEYSPVILQLLDWQNFPDKYVMVLERFSPCMDLDTFVEEKGGSVTEREAKFIFGQATEAAQICCKRGVFHRDIKMENLLINPDTLEVKLIDFGCGDLLKETTYTVYFGTIIYCCPEFIKWDEYHAKPATVFSLGVLLFFMVCGRGPYSLDLEQINRNMWSSRVLTEECCDLIRASLQSHPDRRITLEKILDHKWFQNDDVQATNHQE